jgi:hypothetical protein
LRCRICRGWVGCFDGDFLNRGSWNKTAVWRFFCFLSEEDEARFDDRKYAKGKPERPPKRDEAKGEAGQMRDEPGGSRSESAMSPRKRKRGIAVWRV